MIGPRAFVDPGPVSLWSSSREFERRVNGSSEEHRGPASSVWASPTYLRRCRPGQARLIGRIRDVFASWGGQQCLHVPAALPLPDASWRREASCKNYFPTAGGAAAAISRCTQRD